ncbi:MAG TPA: dicarboxylate/amino acid:cation symporter [Gemmatimonadales bacterium]|nr:dicarboxylate/amino acid:cation symporter [Gemmatimonadales bacterium]
MRSHVWMAAGLVAGLLLGLLAAATQHPVLLRAAELVRPLGRLFLNLLTMVVIPLVAAALFTGVAGLGNLKHLGRLGARTLGFFWGSTLVAIVLGFLVAGILLPLAPIPAEQQAALRQVADTVAAPQGAEQPPGGADFIVALVPRNPVQAAVDGHLLPLIVFITIFAVAATSLPDERRRVLIELADGATQALIKIVQWVLLLAPVGIFALVAPEVARFGWSLVKTMLALLVAVILGCLLLIAAVYLPATILVARLRPARFLRASLPSLAMGFSTTSSLAALPTMLDGAERDLGLSRRVAGFVLPLGASLNRAGSALYQAVAVTFAAQLYGVNFGFAEAFQAGAAVFLASLTVAAIPSGSVLSLAPAFMQTGLPLTGLTLLIGVDRLPDMFRTMTNVAGHLTGAAVVAALEGERPGSSPSRHRPDTENDTGQHAGRARTEV